MDFRNLQLADLAADVRSGRRSAREVAQHSLARIAAEDDRIGAFVHVDEAGALAAAAAIDEQVARGEDVGVLAGVPVAVKDNEHVRGMPTSHGSWLTHGHGAAPADSTVVARLRAAGCVVVGKTNLSELAYSGHTSNHRFGTTRNPWNTEHSAGGSSGGSAAAVAAGMVPLATGSDGGGSVRIPSALCGLSGMKPTPGRVPDHGARDAGWLGLSTPAPVARTVADLRLALAVVSDPPSVASGSVPAPVSSLRVGWAPTLGYGDPDPEIQTLCERALTLLGAEVEPCDAVLDADPYRIWLTIVGACLNRTLSDLADPDDDLPGPVDPHLLRLARRSAVQSATDLVRALDGAHAVAARLRSTFSQVDLLLTPTTAVAAPPVELGGLAVLRGARTPNWVQFTYPFNLAGVPAATVCVGLTSAGLPVGVQVVGPPHHDDRVLAAAAVLEQAVGFWSDAAPEVVNGM